MAVAHAPYDLTYLKTCDSMHGCVSLDEKDIDGFATGSGVSRAEWACLGCLIKVRIE